MPAPLLLSLLLVVTRVDVDAGVILHDGSAASGVLATTTLEMTSAFGSARIDSDSLMSIEFGDGDGDGRGDVDVVRTLNGSELHGTVKLETIELKTAAGTRTISRADAASLHVSRLAPAVPGRITEGTHWNSSTYYLRVPQGYDPAQRYPAIVFLHGTNSNSAMYIRGICARWPDVCARYIMIGVNGTVKAEQSTGDQPQYLYKFVEYAGRSRYPAVPGAERESPALVAEVVADLKQRLPLSTVFLTGHSMGGYMTYSTFMNFPELFDGVMPVSGAMVKYDSVDAYDDAALQAAQRATPVAVVHATNDDIVAFDDAKAAIESMKAAGFDVKLFTNDTGAHKFLLLPFDQGLKWLEGEAKH